MRKTILDRLIELAAVDLYMLRTILLFIYMYTYILVRIIVNLMFYIILCSWVNESIYSVIFLGFRILDSFATIFIKEEH